ncbi:Uncharacterised protein [Mycobacteroides abscessus]|nr:Uncharacterised protein [Mycobacteroides abscessus]CPS74015.1 Uncharacterised protein [Mycobacteroides abscessus]CPY90136.1 Uncharacterised protein [Mycobacteroides abscessus]CPY90828.1 Uncharacterised protein [Mycobacteroides abscessus]SLJ60089.1 Uncharacterised protein [Mycobacteroides abscessus subsp. abscessus]
MRAAIAVSIESATAVLVLSQRFDSSWAASDFNALNKFTISPCERPCQLSLAIFQSLDYFGSFVATNVATSTAFAHRSGAALRPLFSL